MEDIKISPRAFVGPRQPMAQPQMAQSFVQPQQPQQESMGLLNPGSLSNVSEGDLASVLSRYEMASKMADQGGFAGLGGGIASIFLGQKAAKLQEELSKTQVQQQNLELESKFLSNKKVRTELTAKERELEKLAGFDALSRIESNASGNIDEDVRLAGAEFNENKTVKTNWQKAMELQKSGEIPASLNIEELAMFSPGLIMRMGQKYSKFTSESVIAELNDAGKEYRKYQDSLIDLKKQVIRTSKGSSSEDIKRKNFQSYGTVIGNLGKIMESLTDPVTSSVNPGAVKEITDTVILPGLKAAQDFAVENGIIKKDEGFSPKQGAEAVDELVTNKNPAKMKEVQTKMLESLVKAQGVAAKPVDSPDRTKTTKAPPVVSTQGTVRSKEEIKIDPRLESLGKALGE